MESSGICRCWQGRAPERDWCWLCLQLFLYRHAERQQKPGAKISPKHDGATLDGRGPALFVYMKDGKQSIRGVQKVKSNTAPTRSSQQGSGITHQGLSLALDPCRGLCDGEEPRLSGPEETTHHSCVQLHSESFRSLPCCS